MKIAISTTREGTVFEGHFAHAEQFHIFEYESGRLKPLEVRENPLGAVADIDDPKGHEGHPAATPEGVPLHGIPKYAYLKEKVLYGVDAVIAGGACQTSYAYFTQEGVKVLFAKPVKLETIIQVIEEDPQTFDELVGAV
jgi:predicted Fe-Mo cluster-binding NifX family protein